MPLNGIEFVTMKRDMDLVRQLLLRVEESEYGILGSEDFMAEGWEPRTVATHMQLLQEAGFLEANLLTHEGQGALRGKVERLTWAGHDYLDAVRNDTIWNRQRNS